MTQASPGKFEIRSPFAETITVQSIEAADFTSIARASQAAAILLRAQVWVTRRNLDRALAAGRSAAMSPRLELRAEQLTSYRMRERWSGSLRAVVAEFDRPSPPCLSSAIPGVRNVLGIWREPLLELSQRLRDRDRVCPCGMARLRIVMTDGAGPLLNPRATELMGELLCWIDEGMER